MSKTNEATINEVNNTDEYIIFLDIANEPVKVPKIVNDELSASKFDNTIMNLINSRNFEALKTLCKANKLADLAPKAKFGDYLRHFEKHLAKFKPAVVEVPEVKPKAKRAPRAKAEPKAKTEPKSKAEPKAKAELKAKRGAKKVAAAEPVVETIEEPVIADNELAELEEFIHDPLNPKIVKKVVVEAVFRKFEQWLYNEGITGVEACSIIIKLFTYRLLQSKFVPDKNGIIGIDIMDLTKNINAYGTYVDDQNINYVLIKNLVKEVGGKMHTEFIFIWDNVLSCHPKTKHIFAVNDMIILTENLCNKLLKELARVDFENIDSDILADVYQHFIHKQFNSGKNKMGQHLTPLKIVDVIMDLCDGIITGDSVVCDPFMGTGGFLSRAYKKLKLLNPLSTTLPKQLYGNENDPKVAAYAKTNMLLLTNDICENLIKTNTLTTQPDKKFDLVLTNPPFAVDTKTYEKASFYKTPVKTNNATLLCLLYALESLKPLGTCITVWPDGKEMNSKGKSEFAVRKYIMENFNVQKIIYLSKGVFEHTAIKTVILVIKRSDIKEPTAFYNYDDVKNEMNVLDIKSNDDIITQNYSWKAEDYKEKVKLNYIKGKFEIKKLGDICNLEIGGTPSRSITEYYENGTNIWVSVSELNGLTIMDSKEKITDLGVQKSSVKLQKKGTILMSFKLSLGKMAIAGVDLYTNEAIVGINPKNDNTKHKYIYYYLQHIDMSLFANGLIGTGSLNKTSLAELEIPIPTIELQTTIVEEIEIHENHKKSIDTVINATKDLINKIPKRRFWFTEGQFEIKKLGEVCTFKNGTNITKEKLVDGPYPVIGGGRKPMGMHNAYNVDENTIIISKDGVDAGYISMYPTKSMISNHGIYILKDSKCEYKYIYYYLLSVQQNLYQLQKGLAQPGINKDDVAGMEIPIPSIEVQLQFIQHRENLLDQVAKLKQDIETLKNLKKKIDVEIKNNFFE